MPALLPPDPRPAVTPDAAAAILFNVADLLELADDNPCHSRAYRRAARLLLRRAAADLPFTPSGALDVPGLGPKLSAKLGDLFNPTHPRKETAPCVRTASP